MGQAGAIWAGAWRKRSTCPRGPRRTGCWYAVDRGLRDDLAFTVVEPLTEHEIRAAFVNCSKGEAKRLHVPRTGKAGQQGNSIGAYIYGDLACPLYTRGKKFTSSSTRLQERLTLEEKVERNNANLAAFLTKVTA